MFTQCYNKLLYILLYVAWSHQQTPEIITPLSSWPSLRMRSYGRSIITPFQDAYSKIWYNYRLHAYASFQNDDNFKNI